MRIAYIAPYQGAELLRRRPLTANLALAGNIKIELIAELLARKGHDVEIISQGEVVAPVFRYFPGLEESTPREPSSPVFYASAVSVRFLNGYWSGMGVLSIFKARHRRRPFDVVLIYNLNRPQVEVGLYAAQTLGLPVVVEFEDDSFVDVAGRTSPTGLRARWRRRREVAVMDSAAGSICVSPHLQTRFRPGVPGVLLRGVIGAEITEHARRSRDSGRKKIVAFSGTFTPSKGLVPLIEAWKSLNLPGWELHIAGDGRIAADLRRRAEGASGIRFRGLLSRREFAAFLSECLIGVNPHDLSETPGNVFAFKIIEYLAAGLHVITTPMGKLESALEAGITYIDDNAVEAVAKGLSDVIHGRLYSRVAEEAATRLYGGSAVSDALDHLFHTVAH